MASILMDVLKPEIDEKIDNTTRTNLYLYVQKGKMALNDAADEAHLSIADFSNAMTSAGYTVPQNAQNTQNT